MSDIQLKVFTQFKISIWGTKNSSNLLDISAKKDVTNISDRKTGEYDKLNAALNIV